MSLLSLFIDYFANVKRFVILSNLSSWQGYHVMLYFLNYIQIIE